MTDLRPTTTRPARRPGASARRRVVAASILVVLATLGLTRIALPASAAGTDPCSTGNAIVCENSKPGNPQSEWDIIGSGDDTIQGFSTQMSVTPGSTVQFKIKAAKAYTIQVYRLGYYGGLGARLQSGTISVPTPATQPSCVSDPSTYNYDCGNWSVSAQWAVPSTAVSGVYVAHLKQTNGDDSHITFVVRDDSSHSDVIFKTSDMTWQAYNSYGGADFYTAPSQLTQSQGRAFKISYNRPYATRDDNGGRDFVFSNEYPTLRFLERNGVDVSYTSDIDVSEGTTTLTNHKAFFSVGHDEYWSLPERTRVESARDHGVNMMFLSGNEVYWHTRLEPSIDGTSTADRTLVCYKDTWENAPLDPTSEGTSTWRDPRFKVYPNGRNPENSLTGTAYMANDSDMALTVSQTEGKTRLWRNTTLATTSAASTALAPHTVGYESDEDLDNGSRPAGLMDLSTTTGAVKSEVTTSAGWPVQPGTTTHHLTLYRAASGALVFGAGTVQWGWGLDQNHDGDSTNAADVRMQQATLNLLADMSVFPTTLMSGLTMPTASTDKTAPTVTVNSPTPTSTIANGTTVTVTGTASDSGGGVVTTVEVSLDGGQSYHRATGLTSWSYTGVLSGDGSSSILVRANDDSANLSTPIAVGVTVPCPCSLFGTAAPKTADAGDPSQVELGVKFVPASDGFISAIKFYKGSGNTGTHTGTLWSADGKTALASGVFGNESATGWQSLTLSPAVAVKAGTTYVASYYAPVGHYAADGDYFGVLDQKSPPLTAPGAASNVKNGVYANGHGFPSTPTGTNYWVDVTFTRSDVTVPSVVRESPLPNASSVASTVKPTVTFAAAIDPSSLVFTLATPVGTAVTGTASYDPSSNTATFTPAQPLDRSTTYSANVSASSKAGVAMPAPVTWSFTTAAIDPVPGSCPCQFFADSTAPDNLSDTDTTSVELGTKLSVDADGQITAIRFYKGPQNIGTHVGTVWSATGASLGTVTFANESSTGWQTAYFANPVTVSAGATYLVSYRATQGAFSYSLGGLAGPTDVGPLHSPATGGLYTYGTGAPTSATTTNYYVDVVYVATDATPVVTATSPAANDVDVNPTRVVTATFRNGIVSGSAKLSVVDANGNAVAGAVSYAGATRTVTFTPSAQLAFNATYTATVSGAKAYSGRVVDTVSWSFTTSTPGECPCGIFGKSDVPSVDDGGDGSSIEVGTSFTAAADGRITGMRFYKSASNTGTHTGSLWSVGADGSGTKLISGTFTGETGSGWQTLTFSRAIRITAGTKYVVSYYAPRGHYTATAHTFDVPYYSPLITVPAGNGLYRYGTSGFPTSTFNATNYWVDPILDTSVVVDTTAPFLIGSTPLDGSSSQSRAGVLTASWDDDVVASSVKFTLIDSSGTSVPGTVTYDSVAATSTFTPTSPLSPLRYYSASVSATDLAGNSMSTPASWTFRTASADPVVGTCPCGLYTDSTAPATLSADDPNAVELGMAFSPDQDGQVSAVRFYKGPANPGPHKVSLWSANGALLGSATTTGAESTAGWQTATLSQPVPVSAGLTYVVSYLASAGSYSLTDSGLSSPLDVGPLHTPANAGRYVYGGGYPNNGSASSYFVDPVFSLTGQTPDTTPPVISNVAATPYDAGNGATVTWQTDESSSSVVMYGPTPSLGQSVKTTDGLTHSVAIGGLTDGTTYYYRVRSVDPSGNAAGSPDASTAPATFVTGSSAPPVISAVAVNAQDTTATVTWTTDVASTSLVSYGTSPSSLNGSASGDTSTNHSVTLTGLTSGVTYYYRVTSANRPSSSSSSPSTTDAPASFTTPDTTPPAITAVAAQVSGPNAMISWTTDEPSTSLVRYGTTPSLGQSLNGTAGNSTSHSVWLRDLAEGQRYYYQVVSADSSGNSSTTPASPAPPATFDIGDLTPPTIGAVAVTTSGTSATVTWTTNELSTSQVSYGTSATALSSSATGASGTSHSVTLSGLAGGTYYFRVSSADAAGNSSTSPDTASAAATFQIADTTPPTISAVAAAPAASGTAATISWTTDESSTTQVSYGTTADLTNTPVTGVSGTSHSITLSGLASGTTYYYRVTSVDPSGNSSTSPVTSASAATFATPDVTAPSITAVAVTPNGGTGATVTWTTDEVSSTSVAYGTSATTLDKTATATAGTSHSVTLSGLTSGTTYYYRVTSADASGNSSTSPASGAAAASFQTADTTAPTITAVKATSASGSTDTTISWTTDESATTQVSYGTTPDLTNTPVTGVSGTAHSITLSGLASATTYYYRVTSVDPSGNSSTSPVTSTGAATFTTPDVVPPTITAVTATPAATGTTATVTWTTDEASTSVVVYGTSASALTSTATTAGSATSHSVALSGLTDGTTYYYRVTSADAAKNSATSPDASTSPATFTTPDVTAPKVTGATTSTSAAPTGVGTTTFTWTTNEVSSTVVAYGTDANNLTSTATGTGGTTSHLVTVSGLTSNATYYYRVVSADPSGNSTTSPAAPAAASSFKAPDTVAPVVSAVTASAPASSVVVTWTTDESSTSAVAYGTSPSALTSSATGAAGTAHSVTLTGLPLDGTTTAYYRVTSADPSGNTSTSPATTGAPASYLTPDKTPPVVSGATATGTGTAATVVWTTNEASSSKVIYGTSATALTSSTTVTGNVTSHSVGLKLTANTRYYYRVVSVDAAGNTVTSPATTDNPLVYVPTVTPFLQTTAADFTGTRTSSYVSQTGDGEIMSSPTTGIEFDGTTLPTNLSSTALAANGKATVAGGTITISGDRVYSQGTATYPKSIEYGVPSALTSTMRVGLGSSNGTIYAAFGVGTPAPGAATGGLVVLTSDGRTPAASKPIPGIDVTQPHRYRVDWTAAGKVTFVVDGTAVATDVPWSPSAAQMAIMQDTTVDATPLVVNWLRTSPYAASGSYVSKVIDASATVGWDTLSFTGSVPAGTTRTIQVRSGNVATPDGTWTGWTTVVTSGDAITRTSRFLQYQVLMTTSGNQFLSSSTDSVQIGFHVL